MKDIYLDNSATTKICRPALDKYIEISECVYGNPSSRHAKGKSAEDIVSESRKIILRSIGASDGVGIFTSCGSEANNLAIFGRAYSKERYLSGAKLITTQGEHASVDLPFDELAKKGFRIVKLSTRGGKIDEDELISALDDTTVLVSVMMVNNETGALYDVAKISRAIKRKCRDCVLHCDATQSYMKIPINVRTMGIDMLTLSSHKIEGPKGMGMLWISSELVKKKGVSPMILGGGQESGFRSGTENVPAIAAFAEACRYCSASLSQNASKTQDLRSYLLERIASDEVLGEIKPVLPQEHAPHILNLTLPKIKSEVMLNYLSSLGIYVSSGSACSSHDTHISSALVAFGLDKSDADCSIRISFSHENERSDVDALCEALKTGLCQLVRIK